MNLIFRKANREDLPRIVEMLADDFLGSTRERFENPLPECYTKAFEEIEASKQFELTVAELYGEVIGTMQLTFIPNVAIQGGKRMLVESVRVERKLRGQGIGKKFMEFAIDRAKEEGCIYVQLTTNSARTDAHRFYKELGFSDSHVGMKLKLK